MEIFDFTNNERLEEKLAKYKKLEILCDIFTYITDEMFNTDFIVDIIDIIEINLFRSLPPNQLQKEFINYGPGFEKINSVDDPQMIHLNLIYQLLMLVIDFLKHRKEILELLIDEVFVEKTIDLIESEDSDERDYVTKILCKFYQYLPSRRKIIDRIITNKLMEIVSNGHKIYINVENLLEILLLKLDVVHSRDQQQSSMETTKSLLISLHRLPYVYYYHIQLFSCTIKFIRKNPDHLVDLTTKILRLRPSVEKQSHSTTNCMMILVELNHILDCLIGEKKSTDSSTEKDLRIDNAFKLLSPMIFNLFIRYLRSLNTEIVKFTLKIMNDLRYQNYFESYLKANPSVCKQLIGVLENQAYRIDWDYRCHVQQVLCSMYLRTLLETTSSNR